MTTAPANAPRMIKTKTKVEMAEASDLRMPLRFKNRARGSIIMKIIKAKKIGVAMAYK
ncbi:hypothetical protein D3C71_2156630 [compost metagenome]